LSFVSYGSSFFGWPPWPFIFSTTSFRGIDIRVSHTNDVLVVALVALLPAWILSGAFTRDAGVQDLLRTLVRPYSGRWLAFALLFFPAFLLLPAALVHLLGKSLVWPPHRLHRSQFLKGERIWDQ